MPSRGMEPETLPAIFLVFLRLGLTSFGGPVAHLGYFRQAFVVRRRWLGEQAFGELVALTQFLPGPASSQVGFAIGLSRRGLAGGLMAWAGFTLPSALAMFAAASLLLALHASWALAAIHGLKLVAVAVVAQALLAMARRLTPDAPRIAIALAAVPLLLFVADGLGQAAALAFGAVAGLVLCRDAAAPPPDIPALAVSRRMALSCLALFVILLGGLPLAARLSHVLAVFAAFYRAGALVFGGGHVVLPLLNEALVRPGWIANADFLAGYGLAQAVPGPLFTVSVFLGAVLHAPPHGVAGALLALVAIFLPGLLILLAALPFWHGLRRDRRAAAAIRGVNAAVVALLAVALVDPLWVSAVAGWRDAALALGGAGLLILARWPSWLVTILLTAAAILGSAI